MLDDIPFALDNVDDLYISEAEKKSVSYIDNITYYIVIENYNEGSSFRMIKRISKEEINQYLYHLRKCNDDIK